MPKHDRQRRIFSLDPPEIVDSIDKVDYNIFILSRGDAMAQATRVTVTVKYEIEYDGKVTEDDIDINDVIKDTDAIKDIKVKTKGVKS